MQQMLTLRYSRPRFFEANSLQWSLGFWGELAPRFVPGSEPNKSWILGWEAAAVSSGPWLRIRVLDPARTSGLRRFPKRRGPAGTRLPAPPRRRSQLRFVVQMGLVPLEQLRFV